MLMCITRDSLQTELLSQVRSKLVLKCSTSGSYHITLPYSYPTKLYCICSLQLLHSKDKHRNFGKKELKLTLAKRYILDVSATDCCLLQQR